VGWDKGCHRFVGLYSYNPPLVCLLLASDFESLSPGSAPRFRPQRRNRQSFWGMMVLMELTAIFDIFVWNQVPWLFCHVFLNV
jgi:hypothetical protein